MSLTFSIAIASIVATKAPAKTRLPAKSQFRSGLSSEPGPAHFTDSAFEWEKTYLYRITAVSIVKRPDSEVQVEGDDTPPVRVIAHDVFPPSVPAGLQAAFSGEGQKPFIDLIWAPVTNADLAGYNVYRSEAERRRNQAEFRAGESAVVSRWRGRFRQNLYLLSFRRGRPWKRKPALRESQRARAVVCVFTRSPRRS